MMMMMMMMMIMQDASGFCNFRDMNLIKINRKIFYTIKTLQ